MDSLGDRMKGYEKVSRYYLTRRMPLIIRVDGRAFHTHTKRYSPFSDVLDTRLTHTAMFLCENIAGAKFAYRQSDEISILVVDYDKLTTEPWFDKNLQKVVSISAALATAKYNSFHPFTDLPTFDSRAFVVPREEVTNYFIWRQQDWTRNSILMLASMWFSHKEMHGKNTDELQDMLMKKHNINWNNIPVKFKRGTGVYKTPDQGWQPDIEIPIFTKDRNYVEKFLEGEEEKEQRHLIKEMTFAERYGAKSKNMLP